MSWKDIIIEESKKDYYIKLKEYISNEYQVKNIFPPKKDIYKALENTPLEEVKVVLIGQDPYSTVGYANGLSFSVNSGIVIPKSLQNIYKEINLELGLPIPTTGNLELWSKKGILLLNRILTVQEGNPLSHKNKGWETFTMRLISEINQQNRKIVFLLLGNEAKNLKKYLNNPNHLVLETSHPSPLGAYRGFFGSGIFKKTIEFLDCDKSLWSVYDA